MNRFYLLMCVLILASLACGQYVPIVTPTAQVTPVTPSPLPPTQTATVASSTPDFLIPVNGGGTQAQVVRPVVIIRDAPGGKPTDKYLVEGQTVVVIQINGDWAQIEDPAGWVWRGCLSGNDDKRCEADK